MEDRKRFLTNLLRRYLSKVQEHPKVRQMLTPQEAEDGLETIIERIVEEAVKREAKLGRKLTFREFKELMMETLDEFCPEITYIV